MSPRRVFVCVAVLSGLALALIAHRSPGAPNASRMARVVLADRAAARLLAGTHWTAAQTTPLDGNLERVTFVAGGQVVAQFALDRHLHIADSESFVNRRVPYGNWLALDPRLLAGLMALFVLMSAVTPWRRWRNLDVLAAGSMLAPMLLLAHRYVQASVLSALPGLLYLLSRCAWIGLRDASDAPATPLVQALARRRQDVRPDRLLMGAFAAIALIYLMVTVSTSSPVDVIDAVMEGATKLLHGTLPYGHLPGDVVHGDTYPLLSYLAYVPLAALAPVHSTWDSVDLALGATALTAIAVALLLGRAAATARAPRTRFHIPAALTWLCFPTLLMTVSSGTTDVLLAGLVLAAVLLRKRPVAACAVLAVGGCFKLVPFLLLPLWLAPLPARQRWRALAAAAGVCVVVLALVPILGGSAGVVAMIKAISYQFARGSSQSFPAALGLAWLAPIGQALVLATTATTTVMIARAPSAFGARRIAALVAVLFIGLQLTANYWSLLYIAWLAPLFIVALFGAGERADTVSALVWPRREVTVARPAVAGGD